MQKLHLDVSIPQILFLIGTYSWEHQAKQYAKEGPPGISYFKGVLPRFEGKHIDCLLFRDENGELLGILNHYPFHFAESEAPGDFNVWVHPDYWRQGIGKKLLDEGYRRYNLNWNQQTYTPAGAALVRSYLKTKLAFGNLNLKEK